jgi:hypothetical protein
MSSADGPDRRAAVVLATSWETWERLRSVQRCSAATAQRVVEGIVKGAVVTLG